MTGTGYAILSAVVFDIWIAHGYSFNDVNQRTRDMLGTSHLKKQAGILPSFGAVEVSTVRRRMDGQIAATGRRRLRTSVTNTPSMPPNISARATISAFLGLIG